MRDTYIIEREMDTARIDLETTLATLRDVIADKLDVKKRVRAATNRGRSALRAHKVLLAAFAVLLVGIGWWRRRR